MKFKQLTVKIESKEQNSQHIYSAYVIQMAANGIVKGANLFSGQVITSRNIATRLVKKQLDNYVDMVVFK